MNQLLAIPETDPRVKVALDEGIYVEPKDRNPASEDTRQSTWVSLMHKTARACLVFAVPNGARRTRWEAAKVKREGLHTGFPDTGVLWVDGQAYPEWKNGKDSPSDAQIETLNWMHRRGIPVAIVRTPEGCMRWLASIGAPVPAL
jgi:hypothetical protein